jgi:hypothetical protein
LPKLFASKPARSPAALQSFPGACEPLLLLLLLLLLLNRADY